MNAILQSVIEKTIYLGTGRQSYSILQIQVKTFSTINTIEDPCYSADTLGLNEWISAVSTKPDQQSSRKTTIANHTKENILDFLEASWNNLEKSWKDTIPTVSQKVQKTSTGREYLTWQKTVSKKNEEIPQEKSFERNGTFFLLLRRFFKLPNLEFPLHGCNQTIIFKKW